jgi:DNA gyrase subunit A
MTDKEEETTLIPVGNVTNRSIVEEMKESYLTYALSVIKSRALPDVRDGLKPSQRRILVAMDDLNLGPRSKYRKCAKVAGDTSGNYHPHGEAVVYPTMVRMAQDFSLRYPLVDGQGNFGSIDGDPPAAMRYTEARMAGTAVELLTDLDKDTVDYEWNYDETRKQPTVLPSRLPNLLINGSDGIAVGMACSLPPHNLREICQALRAVLTDADVTLNELCQIVKGPDFPTGGIIMGRSGIGQAYTTGRGHVRLRGRYHVEAKSSTKEQLVITEIPYQVKKTTIIDKMVEVVRDGRITGISDVRDESDRQGMRLVVELKRGEDPQVIANQLFKFTSLQTTYSIINLAIDKGQPRTFTLRGLLDAYIDHRRVVIRRRTQFLLNKAEERLHIVEGLRIAVDNIDEVIKLIRASASREAAKAALGTAFSLSERQSQAIVDMRLGSLTGLEREKLLDEQNKLMAEINNLKDILSRDERVVEFIREDLDEIEAKYGDERRTEISLEEVGGFNIEELITEDLMVVTFSRDGYVKRTASDTYRAQARGGRGIKGSDSKEGDVLKSLFIAGTHDTLLCFSNRGKVYWLKVYNLPEAGRTSKGRSISNLITMDENEEITNVLRVKDFAEEGAVFFATKRGVVKKTPLEAFSRPKKGGIWAIKLEDDDSVVGVGLSSPGDTVLLGTAQGRSIRFDEAAARSMGRTARGVRGIRLKEEDKVVGMVVTGENQTILTATARGYGKRTPLEDYPIKGRGGQGVINIRCSERNGDVIGLSVCVEGDDVMFITASGMIVRTEVMAISTIGRNTQGVRLVNLKDDDILVAAQVVSESDIEKYATEVTENGEDTGENATVDTAEGAPTESADGEVVDALDDDANEESEDETEEDDE